MDFESPGFLFLTGLIVFGVVLYFIDRHYGERVRGLTNLDCCARLDALEPQVIEQQKQISFLVASLQQSGVVQNELERQLRDALNTIPKQITISAVTPLIKPLLLICGPDNNLCLADRTALRRAGIAFHRLINASRDDVENELRRRRQDNTLYPWVHVTAHAGKEGVLLADGLADADWWSDTFDGVEVLFLASCTSSAVADKLAGMMAVVYMQEDVKSADAADFTYAFWSSMAVKNDPLEAYRQALRAVPAVAEFVDFRRN